jgi:hypothetical protein
MILYSVLAPRNVFCVQIGSHGFTGIPASFQAMMPPFRFTHL